MTHDDAIAFCELMTARISGWTIAISGKNKSGFIDLRYKQTVKASELDRDIWLNFPGFEKLFAAAMADEDVSLLWPVELQDVVRFRLWHTVPRERNEPFSGYGNHLREVIQGNDPWPDSLKKYSLKASPEDHPPFPEMTLSYRVWKSGATNVIALPQRNVA